ncbi:hypothetical protein CVT26_003405 [Gymnopilus dilepis]|uniref:Aminoglycoside phosphotransferase domain-containing protein n=1 Tax=Gymnopilus dilepis TaxID=231916 RepID=A0A409Y5B6_9AGAR|nr:hypothetical protein CVT26_003405 [Gymnopilus dilepis]
MIPTDDTIFFEDSTFFKNHSLFDLPTSETIKAMQDAALFHSYSRQLFVFPELCLAVKQVRVTNRHRASAAEGQTLWALRTLLPEVRVPEVYGWKRDGDHLFIFMELIRGETLQDSLNDLTEDEKQDICREIGFMVGALRRLKRPSDEAFVGAIGGQPTMDPIFFGRFSEPFLDADAFYESFTRIPVSEREQAHADGRPRLPYDSPLVFTHNDLNPSNILIAPRGSKGSRHVVSIIDWEQSGWMPSFWESCKLKFWLMLGGHRYKDLIDRLPDLVGEEPEDVFMAFVTYVQSWGGLG